MHFQIKDINLKFKKKLLKKKVKNLLVILNNYKNRNNN